MDGHRHRPLVVDFGGGTVDVAVIEVSQPSAEGRPGITVLAADALQRAGDDLDLTVARFALVHQLPGYEEADFEDLDEGLQKQLRLTARDLKHQLTDKLGHTVWPPEPWSKGKPELEHDVTVAMKEWVSRWVRGIGTDLGSFRDVIATARVE